MRIAPGCCYTLGYSTAWSAPLIGTIGCFNLEALGLLFLELGHGISLLLF